MQDNNESVLSTLEEFKKSVVSFSNDYNLQEFPNVIGKVTLYVSKFSNSINFKKQIESIPDRIDTNSELREAYGKVLGIINTIIEEMRLGSTLKVLSASDYNELVKESNNAENFRTSIKELNEQISNLLVENSNLKTNNKNIDSNYQQLDADLSAHKSNYSVLQLESQALEAKHKALETEKVNKELLLNAEVTALKGELSHFKEQAQKTEVARNSTNFHEQAEKNKRIAMGWGGATVTAIIIFLGTLYVFFARNDELFTIAKNIMSNAKGVDPILLKQLILIELGKKIGTRLLMFSVVIYLITFFVKNYNAQMHNYIVNSHKANALRSTVDLIGTAKQDDGNDKIVLQATQAIFTPQKSGYQGAENEPASPNLITNVFDAVNGGKKS